MQGSAKNLERGILSGGEVFMRYPSPKSRCLAVVALGLTLGCSGEIDQNEGILGQKPGKPPAPSAVPGSNGAEVPNMEPGGVGPAPAPPGTPGLPAVTLPAVCKTTNPGPSPLRRLTRSEYANTIRDLVGITDSPSVAFTPDAKALGFDNIASAQNVSQLLAEQFEDGAVSLAAVLVQDVTKTLNCDPVAMGEDACVKKFIPDFGLRAYRRPLTAAEATKLSGFFGAQKAKYGFAPALELLLQVILQSPNFLYRVEFGQIDMAAKLTRFSPYELASRLSYLFLGSMPDALLFQAAVANKLSTAAEVAAQAERLLLDPKSHATVANFHRQWLELEDIENLNKDVTANPNYKNSLRPLWKRETESFLEDLIFKGDARLETMFQADYTFANRTLAAFYGYTGPASDSRFDKVKHNDTRLGLMTQASLMARHSNANQSSPVLRGKFVRELLFCQELPPPPNDIDIKPPPIKAGQSTRERFAIHTQVALCAGCHRLIDPVGFAFENFDAIGQYRVMDQDRPVDANAELTGTDVDGKFVGASELSRRLARSDDVRTCAVKTWFRFSQGRHETAEDECSLAIVREQFKTSGGNIRKLLVALTQTPAFLYKNAGGAP